MKKPKAWIVLTFLVLAISLLSSCATYGQLKEKVFPGVRQVFVDAGPDLLKALLKDIADAIGWPIDQVEGFVGYGGPTDTVPPAK